MIVLGVLSIALLDFLLGKWLPQRFDRSWVRTVESWRPESDAGLREGMSRALAFCVLLAVVGVTTEVLPQWSTRTTRLRPLSAVPATLGDWRASGLKVDEEFLGSVGFAQSTHRRYFVNKGDQGAMVFVAANNRLEPRMSLISGKMAVPGPGYTLVEKTQIRLGMDGSEVDRLHLRRFGRDTLVYHWYLGVDSFSAELLRSALGLDRGPHRRPGRSVSARVSLQMPDSSADWPLVEQELADLAGLVDAELRVLQRPRT